MKKWLLLFILILTNSALADTIPVIDFTAIAKLSTEISDLEQQIKQLDSLNNNGLAQLSKQTQLVNDVEGHYNFGNLYNSSQDLQNREWQPADWQAALNGLSGGNPERYQQLVASYQQQHPVMTSNAYSQGASSARTTQYAQNVQLNQVSSVQATYSYDEINDHFNTVNLLSQQIEQAQNEKSIADLQARLLTEIAYIQMASLRMQTIMNQQIAQISINDMLDAQMAAQFNTPTS